MRAQRDLFGTDHGLVLRMVTVGLLTPIMVFGALVLVMLVLSSFTIRAVVICALGGKKEDSIRPALDSASAAARGCSRDAR